LNKLLRIYLYAMILIGMGIMVYFLNTQTFIYSFIGIMFTLLTSYAQCKDDVTSNLSIAMTASSYVFLTLCFGAFYAIVAYSISITINFMLRRKNEPKRTD